MRKHKPSALARALLALSHGKKKTQIDALIESVVGRYGQSGKLAFLRNVETPLAQHLKEERGGVEGVLRIPHCDEKLTRTIAADVSKRIGRDVELSVVEDPSLIAGAVLTVGDRRYDGSVKARVRQLKKCLAS